MVIIQKSRGILQPNLLFKIAWYESNVRPSHHQFFFNSRFVMYK
jgi:hypothetical protein